MSQMTPIVWMDIHRMAYIPYGGKLVVGKFDKLSAKLPLAK